MKKRSYRYDFPFKIEYKVNQPQPYPTWERRNLIFKHIRVNGETIRVVGKPTERKIKFCFKNANAVVKFKLAQTEDDINRFYVGLLT